MLPTCVLFDQHRNSEGPLFTGEKNKNKNKNKNGVGVGVTLLMPSPSPGTLGQLRGVGPRGSNQQQMAGHCSSPGETSALVLALVLALLLMSNEPPQTSFSPKPTLRRL